MRRFFKFFKQLAEALRGVKLARAVQKNRDAARELDRAVREVLDL